MPLKKYAGIILYHPKKGILLILRDRKKSIPYPNRWTFPGGHVEKGETPLQTVKREVWEELHYRVGKPKYFMKRYLGHSVRYSFIERTNKDVRTFKLGEGQKVAFIPFDRLNKIKIAFGLEKVIRKFLKSYGFETESR